MDSTRYVTDSLPNYLLPSVDLLDGDGQYVFQQENAAPHTARITREWFMENNVNVLKWAPYSPDANPMENVWGLLKRCIFTNMPFRQLWFNLTANYAAVLAGSIQRRCRRIIIQRGLRI